MSNRAIAPIVGVDNKTVHNDLKRAGVENSTPEQAPVSVPEIAPIVGVSQKTADREVRSARESYDSPDAPLSVGESAPASPEAAGSDGGLAAGDVDTPYPSPVTVDPVTGAHARAAATALYARLTRRTVRTLRRYSDGRNARQIRTSRRTDRVSGRSR